MMPKKLFTAVGGLEPFAGVKPTGVQVRVKAQTGPFVPRFIDDEEGVILLLACQRSDVTLKHLDDQPVLRIDLDANEILEVTDRQAGMELIRRMRSERDRAISEASGYDGTTTGQAGETVHADGDGTVLTAEEVAARQGLNIGPSVEEAAAWWQEQEHLDVDFGEATEDELAGLVERLPLNEAEYVVVLDADLAEEGESVRVKILDAFNARMADHADAVNAPGWSPLEAGLPIVEVRRRLATISDRRILVDLLASERAGSGRKRVLQAVDARLAEVARVAEVASETEDEPTKVVDLMANLEESLAAAKSAEPPLPGEDEPVGSVDEEPFG